jgi:hypothetical protein
VVTRRSLAVFLAFAGALVGAAALWPHIHKPEQLSWDPPPELIPPSVPIVLPPKREQLMEFLPDQSIRLLRPNGQEITVRYTAVVADPAWVDLAFYGGWERELEANEDSSALAFVTGPTYERQQGFNDLGIALHGDLVLANGQWDAGNRAAARQRAYLAITRDGELEFGYGRLPREDSSRYRVFVGGLHAFHNSVTSPPESYKGVYGAMTLADVRIVYAWRDDGCLELLETADGLLFSDLELLVKARGFRAAYLPDHASKSRLIIPGQRLWNEEQALWVSGGRLDIIPLPFMLKLQPSRAWYEASNRL